MATLRRTHPPLRQSRSVSGSKRPRSPDQILEVVPKRLKAVPSAAPASHREKTDREKRREQREEFREKYRNAFPSWKFYFDVDNIAAENQSAIKLATAKVRQLGGSIENFFSNSITHLITDQPIPADPPAAPNKENQAPRSKPLKSPNKLRGPAPEEFPPPALDLVSKAKSFENTKVWNMAKLQSVVDRCLDPVPTSASNAAPSAPQRERTLSRLLQSEKINGTSERDPTQKRHDYKYFNRGTYFMLVEDIRSELATVAVQEYVIPKGRDAANTRVPWPVLHCHPHARGPFLPFDEKEKKRWEKAQRLEAEQADERERQQDKMLRVEAMKRKAEARLQACNQSGDLRRSVSMNNMHRRAKLDDQQFVDLDGDVGDVADSTNMGYLPRVYVAASGNSVGITSTTGTTSTTGFSLRSSALPSSLRSRPEVLTSRKFPSAHAQPKNGNMGPPTNVPERRPMLKKSRSTNTMRLPKRDEGSKPGYCECCRTKFEDFNQHIAGRKHRKFAVDDNNFLQLDLILDRVKRRTIEEVKQEEAEWERKCSELDGSDEEEEAHFQDTPSSDCEMVDLDS
ncbi:DBF4-type domain-containing protein [Mycena sanguinolenta]|uniref:DBF4-type domain-containing protein n=1 Tax=Mycena sanguinolenta TaxID=230812 RepID=A0A8H6ZEP0_9AGAR|nr:DBF4-type domain-containing protein [Mycena sanguinolenta]